jgi:hypothetical protein
MNKATASTTEGLTGQTAMIVSFFLFTVQDAADLTC